MTSNCSHYFPEESGLSIFFCVAVPYFYIVVHNSLFYVAHRMSLRLNSIRTMRTVRTVISPSILAKGG
jgi:hypothetical protein